MVQTAVLYSDGNVHQTLVGASVLCRWMEGRSSSTCTARARLRRATAGGALRASTVHARTRAQLHYRTPSRLAPDKQGRSPLSDVKPILAIVISRRLVARHCGRADGIGSVLASTVAFSL